jgi:hypothetical protein
LRKFPVGRFKLLQADHVWLCCFQPGEQLVSRLFMLLMLKVAILMVRREGVAPGCGSRRA